MSIRDTFSEIMGFISLASMMLANPRIAWQILSLRIKILAIVIGFSLCGATAFIVYSSSFATNYEKLRAKEISKTVAYESERIQKIITEMERNAIDLALAGYQFYLSESRSKELGASTSIENFRGFKNAIGGGLWFEPYALEKDKKRLCYYSYYDSTIKDVRIDKEFESEEYDYLAQKWYRQIISSLAGKYSTAWTKPYYEKIGTNSLLTSVGSGIYDENEKLIGIASVDWQIQSVLDRLSKIKPTENSFALLVSPKDNYIMSNTHKAADSSITSINDLPWDIKSDSFKLDGVKYLVFRSSMDNGWLFSMQIPAKEIFADIERRNRIFWIMSLISGMLLLYGAFYLLSKLVNAPLKKLTMGVMELGSGNLDHQIEVHSRDEIGMLAESFNRMTVDLKASIEQNAREHAEKERIGAELSIATQIQANMLPSIFPPFPDIKEFDIYATMQPAKEVGGDFYDFFLIDDKTLAIVIADVSGKGVPAALFMVIAKTLIKNNVQNGKSPEEVFKNVNNILCENNEMVMFVTVFMGYLDIHSGKFTFVNAGHNPPLWLSKGNYSYLETSTTRGFVLGGLEDMDYPQGEIVLEKGDELFLYTDGVTEAMNNQRDLFGDERLLNAVSNISPNTPLLDFTVSVKKEVDKFAEGAEQADDITMLILRYKGGKNG